MNLPLTMSNSLTPEAVGQNLVKLAMELASDLSDAKEVIQRYGLTVAQFKQIAVDPSFKSMYKEAKTLWESDSNAKTRIQTKAQFLVEDSLLEVYSLVHDQSVPAPSRTDAFKTLAKMGAVAGDEKGAAAVGQRFAITMNFGDAPLTLDAEVIEDTEDA